MKKRFCTTSYCPDLLVIPKLKLRKKSFGQILSDRIRNKFFDSKRELKFPKFEKFKKFDKLVLEDWRWENETVECVRRRSRLSLACDGHKVQSKWCFFCLAFFCSANKWRKAWNQHASKHFRFCSWLQEPLISDTSTDQCRTLCRVAGWTCAWQRFLWCQFPAELILDSNVRSRPVDFFFTVWSNDSKDFYGFNQFKKKVILIDFFCEL